jgi:hypothetical protein
MGCGAQVMQTEQVALFYPGLRVRKDVRKVPIFDPKTPLLALKSAISR